MKQETGIYNNKYFETQRDANIKKKKKKKKKKLVDFLLKNLLVL
jgi:hypothetical protein